MLSLYRPSVHTVKLTVNELEHRATPARLTILDPAGVGASVSLRLGDEVVARSEALSAGQIQDGIDKFIAYAAVADGYTEGSVFLFRAENETKAATAFELRAGVYTDYGDQSRDGASRWQAGTLSNSTGSDYGGFVTIRIDPEPGETVGQPVRVHLTARVTTTTTVQPDRTPDWSGQVRWQARYDTGNGEQTLLDQSSNFAPWVAGDVFDVFEETTVDTTIGETFQIAYLESGDIAFRGIEEADEFNTQVHFGYVMAVETLSDVMDKPPFLVGLSAENDIPMENVDNKIWSNEAPDKYGPIADSLSAYPGNPSGFRLIPELPARDSLPTGTDRIQLDWKMHPVDRNGTIGQVIAKEGQQVRPVSTDVDELPGNIDFNIQPPNGVGRYELQLLFKLLDEESRILAIEELTHELYITYDKPLREFTQPFASLATSWAAASQNDSSSPQRILTQLVNTIHSNPLGWLYSTADGTAAPLPQADNLLFGGAIYAECGSLVAVWSELAKTLGFETRPEFLGGRHTKGIVMDYDVVAFDRSASGNARPRNLNPLGNESPNDLWLWQQHTVGVYNDSVEGLIAFDPTYGVTYRLSEAYSNPNRSKIQTSIKPNGLFDIFADLPEVGWVSTDPTSDGITFYFYSLGQRRPSNQDPTGSVSYSTSNDDESLFRLPRTFSVGLGDGFGPGVRSYNADGTERLELPTFDLSLPVGARVAEADFTGNGVADIVVGYGPGTSTLVRIYDGATGAEIFSIAPFEAAFTGGVYVAAGDINGDGIPDLVITPDEGGGPRVRVIDGKTFNVIADFLGIDDPNFRGGARAAIGDIDGDGVGDLVVAAGFQGGPRVAGFQGQSLATGSPTRLFGDFFAFEQDLRNGIFVAVGDIDGDGFAELIAGGGPGGGPRVTAFSGKALLSNEYEKRANFFGGDEANRGGIRLAVKDLDGDDRADLVVGAGSGAGSRVTAYFGKDIPTVGAPPAAFDFDALPGFTGGVFVG